MSSLFFVYSEHGPLITESDFNDWYDNEHIPNLLGVPNFVSAQRYIALQTTTPKFLTLFNLSTPSPQSIFKTPEFASYVSSSSPREKKMLSSLPLLNQRFYTPLFQIPSNFPLNSPAEKYLFVAEVDLVDSSPEFEVEFNEWYNGAHVPDITKTTGWVSSRRFKLEDNIERGTSGSTPAHATKYFAVHEFTTGDYMKDPAMIAAIATPETQRMKPKMNVKLHHFVLHKDFQH